MDGGKQRSAFSVGTLYFRHGAKSEPGTTDDLRKVIDRQVETVRKSWLNGVRKVVEAPINSTIVTISPLAKQIQSPQNTITVRSVKDKGAIPVSLTRDPEKSSGVFVHEELSEGIFDEINNVIEANNVLAQGRKDFFLGEPVYYRIYAERCHVKQDEDSILMLANSALSRFYAPNLYWLTKLSPSLVAKPYVHLYINLKNPNIYHFLRLSILLGIDFCDWLYGKFQEMWGGSSQPPQYYFTFQEMRLKLKRTNQRIISSTQKNITTPITLSGEKTISVKNLLDQPDKADKYLSSFCVDIFNGRLELRSNARLLDLFAYGFEIEKHSVEIADAIITEIGDKKPAELINSDYE